MDFLINSDPTRIKVIGYLNRLPIKTRPYKVKIVKVTKSRSNEQNKYQWYVFNLIAEEFGSDSNTIHDYFCTLFLQVIDTFAEKQFTRTKSTSSLTTIEHNEFMEKIRMWCAVEHGMIIPLPNEIILD